MSKNNNAKQFILRSSPWALAGLAALIGGGFMPESSSLVPCCGAAIPYRFLIGGVGVLLMVPVLREGVLFAVRIKNGVTGNVGKDQIDSNGKT